MLTVDQCLLIIDRLIFLPGYTIDGVAWQERHDGAILVRVHYWTFDYAKAFAPMYDAHDPITVPYYFTIVPALYRSELEFLRAMFDRLMAIQTHEAREAFRIHYSDHEDHGHDEYVGPFNPHEPHGMLNYGDADSDLSFGDLAVSGPTERAALAVMFNKRLRMRQVRQDRQAAREIALDAAVRAATGK